MNKRKIIYIILGMIILTAVFVSEIMLIKYSILSSMKRTESNEADKIISTIVNEIRREKKTQTEMKAENFCAPVETKQIVENPSNIIISQDKGRDGWLRVKNEKYGFEFSYPEEFVLEERERFSGSWFEFTDGYYGAVFAYVLTNPDFGKRMYECPTEGDIEEYGGIEGVFEEIGITPTLNIGVYESRGDHNSSWGPRKKEILVEMNALDIDYDATLATLSELHGYSDYEIDPVTKEKKEIDRDDCSKIILDRIGGRYVIKEYDCRKGSPFHSEEAIFLEKDGFIITVYDRASEFSEYFEEVLSTFEFSHEIQQEEEIKKILEGK